MNLWENGFVRWIRTLPNGALKRQDTTMCITAARQGCLHMLRHAHLLGYAWDDSVCSAAASGGHLDCLRYAHENHCEWSVDTMWGAAGGGHLNCLPR